MHGLRSGWEVNHQFAAWHARLTGADRKAA
jgi:hypothetical protein